MKLVFANNPLGAPEASPENAGWQTVTQDGDNAPGEGVDKSKKAETEPIKVKPLRRKKRRPTPMAGEETGTNRRNATRFTNHDEWKTAVAQSDVRLQWDPDHDPNGNCLERRAVQLGLRDEMLRRFGQDELLSIEDITPFVIEQREKRAGGLAALQTPAEEIYAPIRLGAASAVGIEVVQPPLIS